MFDTFSVGVSLRSAPSFEFISDCEVNAVLLHPPHFWLLFWCSHLSTSLHFVQCKSWVWRENCPQLNTWILLHQETATHGVWQCITSPRHYLKAFVPPTWGCTKYPIIELYSFVASLIPLFISTDTTQIWWVDPYHIIASLVLVVPNEPPTSLELQ